MNLDNVERLADAVPEYRSELNDTIATIRQYIIGEATEDRRYLSEEVIPLLRILIAVGKEEEYAQLVDQIWIDLFKGGAKFNRSYITVHFAPGEENFMKYLDVALFASNPELRAHVGL